MSIAIISDVHIKRPGDEREKLFISFLNHEKLHNVEEIYLLGDIFDLMIGGHIEYLTQFKKIFDKINELIKKNVKFHYFEGNHDFHVEKLFKGFIKLNNLNPELFIVHRKEYFSEIENSLYRFSHGDDIELGNFSYKVYKKIITCSPLRFVANYIMPFSLLNAIGERASKASRQRNITRYTSNDSNELIKEKFREASEVSFKEKNFDYIFCGHSHVSESYNSPSGFSYFNVGYFPVQQQFLIVANGNVEFVKL